MRAEPMGLSDWIGIFAIITFVGFAGMFYGLASSTTEKTVRKNPPNFRGLDLNKIAGF
jgi:hypothetical protein